jgi:hypothetical protein
MQAFFSAGPVPGQNGPVPAPKDVRMVPSWPTQGEGWCGRGDLNPHDLLGSADFHTTSAFAAPQVRVRGLDYPFTIPRERFRCCPSSLYTFPKTSGLGSGLPAKVSPTLSSSAPPVSLAGTQFLKSAVSADFTTPAQN